MNIKNITPLLEATINVLSTMAMVEVTKGNPSRKEGLNPLGDITGLIDLKGTEVHGSLAISFSESAILEIAEKMLGEKIAAIDDTVIDLVGEITNMITGDAKRAYSEQGTEFDLTIPSVLVGKDATVVHSVKGDPIVIPFSMDAGDFYIELCFS